MKLRLFKNVTISILLVTYIFSTGCMKLALRATPSLFIKMEASFFEECDPILAEKAFPSNLKLLEGLLKNDPDNRDILNSLCKGFYGYSMLFVEEADQRRASMLYLRARDYGFSALKHKGDALLSTKQKDINSILHDISRDEFETFLWTTVAWISWINLNLDKPAALAQLNTAQACLDVILKADPEFMYGLPCILKGITLAATPPMFGGEPDESKKYFERAMEISNRNFFLTQYYCARYYAVRIQDRKLFDSLVSEILTGDFSVLKDVCLLNSVIKSKAQRLGEMGDELFI